jgi:hypothetical protein
MKRPAIATLDSASPSKRTTFNTHEKIMLSITMVRHFYEARDRVISANCDAVETRDRAVEAALKAASTARSAATACAVAASAAASAEAAKAIAEDAAVTAMAAANAAAKAEAFFEFVGKATAAACGEAAYT